MRLIEPIARGDTILLRNSLDQRGDRNSNRILRDQERLNAGVRDGYLTLEEANYWYRNGEGQSVSIEMSLLNFDGISVEAFNGIGSEASYTFTPGSNDFFVHGSVRLELVGPNTIVIVGDPTTGFENGGWYDFEMHSWFQRPLRNLETLGAHVIAGSGQRYPIIYEGTATISNAQIPDINGGGP